MRLIPHELKALHLQGLSDVIDPLSKSHGWERSAKSTKYSRSIGESNQTLDIYTRTSRYTDDPAMTHISGVARIRFPAIRDAATKMLGARGDSDPRLNDYTNAVPIGFTRPGEQLLEWGPLNPDDYYVKLREVRDFLESYTFPFLNQYSTLESFVTGYEQNDPRLRIMSDSNGDIMIAAIYVTLGRILQARQLIIDAIGGKAGRVSWYSAATKYLSGLET